MSAAPKSDEDLDALREQLRESKRRRSASAKEQMAQAQKCSRLPLAPTKRLKYPNAVPAAVNGAVNGAEAPDLDDIFQARQLRRSSLAELKRTSMGVRVEGEDAESADRGDD